MSSYTTDQKEDFRKYFENLHKEDPRHYMKWVGMADKLLLVQNSAHIAKHIEAQDIVQTVIEKIIDGKRVWDKNNISIDRMMYMNLMSEISNVLKKERKYQFVQSLSGDEFEEDNSSLIDKHRHLRLEEVLSSHEAEELKSICLSIFEKEDDTYGYFVTEEILKGKTPKEIAEDLEIPVVKVYEFRKKIKKKLQIPIARYLGRDLSVS